jgi:hypothetical protein
MTTALQCSNAACGKVETVPDGILAPTSCLDCGAPLSPAAPATGLTTQPVAILLQPPAAPPAQTPEAVTDSPAQPAGGEPPWLADDRATRRKRPPRISAATRWPKLFLLGYELTPGGLLRVALPLALLAGACALAFWAAARVVTDTTGDYPTGPPRQELLGQPPGERP